MSSHVFIYMCVRYFYMEVRMLNGVSNVSFRASERKAWNDPNVNFDAPQAYPRQAESATQAEPKKKSHKLLKTVVGLAVAAAAVAGAMVAGNKLGWFNKLAQSAGKDWIKNSAEWLNNSGERIAEFGVNCFNKVKGLFKGAEEATGAGIPPAPPAAPAAPEAAEAAAEAAEAAEAAAAAV